MLNSEALTCDCDLKWFPVWIKQFGQKFLIDGKCNLPEHAKGLNILDVDYKNVTCGKFWKYFSSMIFWLQKVNAYDDQY